MRLWGIYYTSWDGIRQQYMSVGFKSESAAQDELDRIMRHRERVGDISHYDPKNCAASLTGSDWEIKEIKLK